MDTKKLMNTILLACVLLALVFAVGVFYTQKVSVKSNDYSYAPAGLTISLLKDYVYEEQKTDTEVRVLFKKVDRMKEIAGEAEVPTEGLPGISCLIVPNVSDLTIPLWVQSEKYQQTEGRLFEGSMYPSVDIPGIDAIGFRTDGLYATNHVAFLAKNYIVDCSVSYITADDELLVDFIMLLEKISLT